MIEPVIRYPAEDGSYHATEIEAVRHNILARMEKSFPKLGFHLPEGGKTFDQVVQTILPLARLFDKDHPVLPETTLVEEPEQ